MTVHEVSEQTGVSVRTLHHYDRIGLLKPSAVTEAGYRIYNEESLLRLQQILFFRELEFPLKEIKLILDSPNFDRSEALEQQIQLLTLKRQRLDRIIALAQDMQSTGGNHMDFTAFDKKQQAEYVAEAKAKWGHTDAYQEYAQKSHDRSDAQTQSLGLGMMECFKPFCALKDLKPDAPKVQAAVKQLQDYITANYYTCTDQILAGLGEMYTADERMKKNIDSYTADGIAEFAAAAIRIYCSK